MENLCWKQSNRDTWKLIPNSLCQSHKQHTHSAHNGDNNNNNEEEKKSEPTSKLMLTSLQNSRKKANKRNLIKFFATELMRFLFLKQCYTSVKI